MIRTISKYMCKQTALATTRTMFQLSWDKNASLSIQHPIQPSTPISPTPSLIRDDQQQPPTPTTSSSPSRLIHKIQDFLKQVAEGTLLEQIPCLVDICTELKHRSEPVSHREYSALFTMKYKVRFDQISTLQIAQLQSLLHYYITLRNVNVIKSSVDIDSALYHQYSKLLLIEGEMCLPIFKVAEMELLFAELTHIRPYELTKLYTYLVNSVFTADFQGVELETMLTLLLALFKHNKHTQPQRDLVGRLLELLKGGYSLLTSKDKIKLVLFVLKYDLEQQYTVYINGQVDILQQFLSDLKKKTISFNDQQIYQTLLPNCQYISAKQKKEIEGLLITHFFQNIDVIQGSKPVFSVKAGLDIINSYSKGRRFKDIDPVHKNKIVDFYKRAFRMQHEFFFFMNIMVMLSNLIFVDFFEGSLEVVQDLKNAIGKRRIGIKLINELSRVGIKVEPFYFEIEENRYEKRKNLVNCNRNAINYEISLLLAYKLQEQIQSDQVYFSDLSKLKYNEFLDLYEANFTAFIHAMFITHHYTLQQFGNAFNLVDFILNLPLDSMDLNINKKRKLMSLMLNCTKNAEICFKGLPIYHYVGPDEFTGIIKKDRQVYFKMTLSPLVLETALHLLSRIIAFGKEKYYKKLLQSLFEVMTTYTKVLLLENPAGKLHSCEYQAYWQVLYFLVDNYPRLKQAEGQLFKFKSLLREVLQATGNMCCSSQEMDTFLKKCMVVLFDEKEVGFLVRKVVLKGIYARLINSQNCLEYMPKIQVQDIMTPEMQTLLDFLQNKQCSSSKAAKAFVFEALRSNGNLSSSKLSEIYKFFKHCERINIFIKVLCLFDLQVNSSNSRLYFYVLEQLSKQDQLVVCRKYNIIAILANIRKYFAAYDSSTSEYTVRYQFVSQFLHTLLNNYTIVYYRETPIVYLCELLAAAKQLQVRNLVLEQKLLKCLQVPYQTLWGSLAIIKYLMQVGHEFSAGELANIDRWVVMASNKKKLREWKATALKDSQQLCINLFDLSLSMQFDATYLQIISAVDASMLASQQQNKKSPWDNWQRFVLWRLPRRIVVIVQSRDKLDAEALLQKINALRPDQKIAVSESKLIQRNTHTGREQIASKLNLQPESELIDYLYYVLRNETASDFQQKYELREEQVKRKSASAAYRNKMQPQQEEL